MQLILAPTDTPSICFRARFALLFGDEIFMSLALLFTNQPVSLYFIINDQIMENELGAWLFIIFFISLFFYSKQQSYFIPDSRILWFIRLACLRSYLMEIPQSFSCFYSIALKRQQKNLFNGWSHHRISAS